MATIKCVGKISHNTKSQSSIPTVRAFKVKDGHGGWKLVTGYVMANGKLFGIQTGKTFAFGQWRYVDAIG